VPTGARHARVVATGTSKATGRRFNIAVAFDRVRDGEGRAVAESTFHHFADYNWEPAQGCPSFVSEPCGDGMRRNPEARRDAEARVSNLARWLLPA